MNTIDVERISQDPKFAPAKRKNNQKTRSVRDLFADVDQEPVFKDKRGRPWVKNPLAYAKTQRTKNHQPNTNEAISFEMAMELEHVPKYSQLERKQKNVEGETSDEEEQSEQSDSVPVDDESATSIESDTEIDPTEVIADLQDADWHELIKDAPPAKNTGKRLALLHFDWDNAKAENIYMVLESFLPPRGHIECVTIYPSEFGIKRMAEEAVHGPQELVDKPTEADEASDANDEDNQAPLDVEERSGWRQASTSLRRRIRQYQLARLKYFYAVIEFDSADTAEAVYNACDGFEYESSGARLDLRFVDDEEKFSVPPEHAHLVSECREINKAKYTPRPFETSALHRTRIGISWDKTPAERTCWLRDQFKPEADPRSTLTEDPDELEKYLVLSSSGASTAASSDVDEEPPAPTVPRIRRHRPKKMTPEELRVALLGAIGADPSGSHQSDDECDNTQTGDMNERSKKSNSEEDEEEVFDLNPASDAEAEDDGEQYELGPVEKKASKHLLAGAAAMRRQTQTDAKKRKIRRLILPEAVDDQLLVDSSASSSEELEPARTTEKSRKRKYKQRQRNKMLTKKRKVQERLERQARLWNLEDEDNKRQDVAGAGVDPGLVVEDDRFDQFLVDPTFRISQTHPDYKEAVDFLRYMRRRKALQPHSSDLSHPSFS
ncbi:Pre-rRNA-processing protein esf1 [Fasciola hepatica]|uniref:Pre-rRNA-processing protein esf1 n=1 Tax=Fasciola hepatica TaxID=6192 RepID=A0A4E0S2N1_FASHE|nr:Pre-rRNA-processing protein esf1 [Fasciola hepatica]